MENYPVYPYGHDFGNNENCGVLIGATQRIERRIPSVTAIGSWKNAMAFAAGSGKTVQETLAPNHYILEYDQPVAPYHVEKIVGQRVFDDGSQPLSTHGDSARYWKNNYSLEMLMVASASMTTAQEYGLHVVTGLPISIFLDNDHNKGRVADALTGDHMFTLNGTRRIMHVQAVKVIMEGAGALIEHGSADNALQAVIDIGGRTTDLFVARGQKAQRAQSTGFPLGVSTIADRLNEKFRSVYHYQLSLQTRMQLLREHISGQPYKAIKEKETGKSIPPASLAPLIESALREIGKEIATKIVTIWDEMVNEMDTILIVGGGAHYIAQDIQARIPSAKTVFKPEMANAFGYAMLAEASMARLRVVRGA